MKIICDNCGAKYSIADEKVKGKTFKIRCKKCQESIVVRGDAQPAPKAEPAPAPGGESETKVFDYSGYRGDEAVWYVAVDGGQQQGPYATTQMIEFLSAGNITADSYIWREGFDDWKQVSTVPEISGTEATSAAETAATQPAETASAVAAGAASAGVAAGGLFDAGPGETSGGGGGLFDSAPADSSGGGGLFDSAPADSSGGGGLFDSAPTDSASGGGLFDGNADASADGGDLFSSGAANTSTGGLFNAEQNAKEAGAEVGGALFDRADSASSGGDLFSDGSTEEEGGIFASTDVAGAPRVSQGAVMTGQRNENSVLFSLANLQALAQDSGPAPGAAAGNNPAGAGMASNEASGLIDIRAMASSLAAEAEKADDVDEMLAMGGGGFAPTLGAPVLQAAAPSGLSTGAKVGIIAGVVVVLAAIVVVAVMMLRTDSSAQDEKIALLMKQIKEMQAQGASAEEIKNKMVELDEAKKVQSSGDVVPVADNSGTEKPAATEESTSSSKSRRNDSRRRSSSKGKAGSTGGSSSGSTTASAPSSSVSRSRESSTSKKSEASKTLDALLGGGGNKPVKKTPAKATSSGGTKLTRNQVIAGMKVVSAAVKRCGAGQSGTFKIRAVIGADGRVKTASAVGQFKGTPAGSCAGRAVRRARFPSSSSSTTVTYPFKI